MKERRVWKKYAVSFGVATVAAFLVLAIKGFFRDNVKDNMSLLADVTFIVGILFVLFAGMLFIGGEGGFLGIGFVLGKVARSFLPMGRKNTEMYAQYRERKLKTTEKSGDTSILWTGIFFLLVCAVFTIIWYNV